MGDGSLRAAWEAHADEWAAFARTPGHDTFFLHYNLPAFLELVPPPGELALEVGCGEGRVARVLVELGHLVVAIESSSTLVRLAATDSSGVRVAQADAGALPLADASVDLVVSFMVLMDLDDLGTATKEFARVLAPGGVICAAIMHPIASAGLFVPDDPNHTFALGEYRRTMRHTFRVERDGLGMTFNSEHRPLETYSRALEDAGLVITALREPIPTEFASATHPEMVDYRRVPTFLHFTARHAVQ